MASAASGLRRASNAGSGMRRASIQQVIRIKQAIQSNRAFIQAQKTGTPLRQGFSIKETRGELTATKNSRWMFHMEQINAAVGIFLTCVAIVFVVQYEFPEEGGGTDAMRDSIRKAAFSTFLNCAALGIGVCFCSCLGCICTSKHMCTGIYDFLVLLASGATGYVLYEQWLNIQDLDSACFQLKIACTELPWILKDCRQLNKAFSGTPCDQCDGIACGTYSTTEEYIFGCSFIPEKIDRFQRDMAIKQYVAFGINAISMLLLVCQCYGHLRVGDTILARCIKLHCGRMHKAVLDVGTSTFVPIKIKANEVQPIDTRTVAAPLQLRDFNENRHM